ncbi:NADP-dependent oxidoreductase domain-containing protein [Lentinula detonsa]|uniref:NADP-dependent oxidoreductase domain-containing protein n=1 Tax=Lentinula detonsa TaxID=2804962 RepID=A0AA38UMJ3_9AGAR|nr:NADP-dependent oxidoreductase domain-containing protein [Lentinula detonsa]
MGSMNKESSFKLLNVYMGGNFIDTANSYQNESSEKFIREWMEKRQIRDQLVIATKYSIDFKIGDKSIQQRINYISNNAKSLHISVEASLKKLRTSYIDILYLHFWDFDTSVEEVMDSLHNLVVSGKVIYLGISDTPAWIVSQANQYTKDHGKTPFDIYQGKWSILDRSFELTLTPWSVVGGGKLYTDAEEQRRKETGKKGRDMGSGWERNEKEKVAKDIDAKSITAVAITYVMQKTPHVFPIISGRKVENLVSNLEALDISLSNELSQLPILPASPVFSCPQLNSPTPYLQSAALTSPTRFRGNGGNELTRKFKRVRKSLSQNIIWSKCV